MKYVNDHKRQVRMGISVKLMGLLLPTVSAVLALILLLIYFNVSKIVLVKSEDLLQSNSESAVNGVTAWMNRVITAVDATAQAL